ncbi:MAG: DNA repair protein RecN [Acidobacteria bacterium]|nr:DNA repair protein RecN [Acidobacteriota bacterium]
MLRLLKINNIALIDDLEIEFGEGLNLLTGETGSGKSIIIDGLGALSGERISSDLIKQGESSARIEGVFSLVLPDDAAVAFAEAGVEVADDEIIVRRELSAAGKNRVFVNDRLVTQNFLKRIGHLFADISGQGEQAMLYDPRNHLVMLDAAAGVEKELAATTDAFRDWAEIRRELNELNEDESAKLRSLDILRFEIDEIERAGIRFGEEEELGAEKLRVVNSEKLAAASDELSDVLYDADLSTTTTLERASRRLSELAEFESEFRDFAEGIASARVVVEELAATARRFRSTLEVAPGRIDEIEMRLAELSRLKRKYGGTIEAVLDHLEKSRAKLDSIELAGFREKELSVQLAAAEARYRKCAEKLSRMRVVGAEKFKAAVEKELGFVALEKAMFEIRFTERDAFSADGTELVEFYFSANPGEPPRPLAKVASGGEVSRLMLVLRTVSGKKEVRRTAVFDEIDIGIGGRVAEAVGRRLQKLSAEQQVLCVTHQPQIASLADHHFVVEKTTKGNKTSITVRELSREERVEEVARMLAGSEITKAARENAKAMLAASR